MAYIMRWSLLAPIPAWVQFFLIWTLLLFPISSSARSVCLVLSVGTIVFTSGFIRDLKTLFSTHWCKAILFLFCITIIFCLWSPASTPQQLVSIEKYSKLLYLPIFVIGFQNVTTRQLSLYAFLLAMLITCSLSILKFHGYLSIFSLNPDNVFHNHIITSFMVAFAAYISFLFSYSYSKYTRLLFGILGIIFTYQILFVSGSRTGYLIYLVLMSLLMIQFCTWRQTAAGIALISTLFIATYFASPVMKIRIDGITHQMQEYLNNERDTDLGLRLQFHNYAHQLFNQHPILGNGTASFGFYFNKEKPINFWTWNLLEPHSQYWLVACEFGLIGFGVLLYFLFSLLQASRKLVEMKAMAIALLISFLIGNLSDSLLFYSSSGYFFIFFMALFLGEELEIENEKKCLNFGITPMQPTLNFKIPPLKLT